MSDQRPMPLARKNDVYGIELLPVGWVEPPGPAFGRPDDKLRETHHQPRHLEPPSMGFADAQPILRGYPDGLAKSADYSVTCSRSGLSLSMILSSTVRAGLSVRF